MLANERIKYRRIKRDIGTQQAAGQLMHPPVSQAKWSRWERGLSHPRKAERLQLAQILGGKPADYDGEI